jgi:hypothetical protein
MSQNLKTRREHLKVLPLQKRLQAMENIRKEAFKSLSHELDKLSDNRFLLKSFTFSYTRQGNKYWWDIHYKYFQDGK